MNQSKQHNRSRSLFVVCLLGMAVAACVEGEPSDTAHDTSETAVTAPAQTIFGTAAPSGATISASDPKALELGVKFTSGRAGQVASVRFFRGTRNPQGYTVHLWNSSGALLGTAQGSDQVVPGWQEIRFPTPIPVSANTTYIASYYTSNGRYAYTYNGFATARTSGDLTAPANAGVYHYGPSGFPTNVYRATNYWVDVSFVLSETAAPAPAPAPAPPPAGTTPAVCDRTLSPGANVASAVSIAANGSTICLNSGDYGVTNLWNIARTGYVTLASLSGTGAKMSPSVGNSDHIRFDRMSLANMLVNNKSANIQITNSAFLANHGGLAVVNSSAILIDNVDFTKVNQATWSGRLSLNNASSSTISNSKFVGVGADSADVKTGAADGIMIVGGSSNNTIGPNNLFSGILQSLCDIANPGSHCDSIQLYGAGTNNVITGNYFDNGDTFIMSPDGVDDITVTHNVFNGDAINYDWKIQFGSANGAHFEHNTLTNTGVTFDSKTGNPASTNVLAKNNIIQSKGIKVSGGSGCVGNCVFDHNMFGVSTIVIGTNASVGMPTFTGGVAPVTFSGYQLTPSSIGYKAATDGTDMGK